MSDYTEKNSNLIPKIDIPCFAWNSQAEQGFLFFKAKSLGAKGILKKVWYWIVIGMAFFVSMSFVHMGEIIGINLSFVQLFGWFTLATYLINEVRSILENLVEMNVNVPQFLIAGLDITQKLLDSKTEIKESEE